MTALFVLYWFLPLLICGFFVDIQRIPDYIFFLILMPPFFVADYFAGRTKEKDIYYLEYYYSCWFIELAILSGVYSLLDKSWNLIISINKSAFIIFSFIIPYVIVHAYHHYKTSKKHLKKYYTFGKEGNVEELNLNKIEKEGFRLLACYRTRDEWVKHLIENTGGELIRLFGRDYKKISLSLKSMWEWGYYKDPRSGIKMSWKDWAKFFGCSQASNIYFNLNHYKEECDKYKCSKYRMQHEHNTNTIQPRITSD